MSSRAVTMSAMPTSVGVGTHPSTLLKISDLEGVIELLRNDAHWQSPGQILPVKCMDRRLRNGFRAAGGYLTILLMEAIIARHIERRDNLLGAAERVSHRVQASFHVGCAAVAEWRFGVYALKNLNSGVYALHASIHGDQIEDDIYKEVATRVAGLPTGYIPAGYTAQDLTQELLGRRECEDPADVPLLGLLGYNRTSQYYAGYDQMTDAYGASPVLVDAWAIEKIATLLTVDPELQRIATTFGQLFALAVAGGFLLDGNAFVALIE